MAWNGVGLTLSLAAALHTSHGLHAGGILSSSSAVMVGAVLNQTLL